MPYFKIWNRVIGNSMAQNMLLDLDRIPCFFDQGVDVPDHFGVGVWIIQG